MCYKNASPEVDTFFLHHFLRRHRCKKTLTRSILSDRMTYHTSKAHPNPSFWPIIEAIYFGCCCRSGHDGVLPIRGMLHRLHDGQDSSETKMIITHFLPVCQDSNMFWCYLAWSSRKTFNCWWRWITKLEHARHMHDSWLHSILGCIQVTCASMILKYQMLRYLCAGSCILFYWFSVQHFVSPLCCKASTSC